MQLLTDTQIEILTACGVPREQPESEDLSFLLRRGLVMGLMSKSTYIRTSRGALYLEAIKRLQGRVLELVQIAKENQRTLQDGQPDDELELEFREGVRVGMYISILAAISARLNPIHANILYRLLVEEFSPQINALVSDGLVTIVAVTEQAHLAVTPFGRIFQDREGGF